MPADDGRWQRLRELRAQVTETIEPLRREKIVGSSLEAEITVPELLAPPEALAELFIVSSVSKGDALTVEKTAKHKCGRCWRYLPEVKNGAYVTNRSTLNLPTDAYSVFDAFASYTFNERFQLRAGIDNLLNEDPAIVGATPTDSNSNSTLAGYYDTLGRRWVTEVVLPRRHRTTRRVVGDAWVEERLLLAPLPPQLLALPAAARAVPPPSPARSDARREDWLLGSDVEVRDLAEYELALAAPAGVA